ncbi:MAG: hypothetical protein RB296_03265 [Acidobacteriota bacterium]|jgi:hypothetical protein|nr:hypothetical protein [Acidobacteriota bacterium]
MTTEFERDREERQAIRLHTRPAIRAGVSALLIVALCALLSRLIAPEPLFPARTLESLFGISVLVIILIMVIILAARKTVYYSSRLVRDDMTISELLRRWNRIDLILIGITTTIPLIGLALTWFGIPFARTWFIFLVSALLLVILLPMGIKVRGKLLILRQHHPDLNA